MSIPVLSWIDDIIKQSFASVFSQVNQGTDEFLKSRDILHRGQRIYSEFVRNRFGQIQVLGMSSPIPLDRIYVRLRVNRQVQSKQFLDMDLLKAADRKYLKKLAQWRDQTSADPIDVVTRTKRIALLGKPGSGKTTFLRYLSLLYTGTSSHSAEVTEPCFPILVILREFVRQDTDLMTHICQIVRDCGFPYADLFVKRLLNSGDMLVMIDGLDEFSGATAEKLYSQIQHLVSDYPKNRYIASCRTAAYMGVLEGFTEVEIEDFRPRQKYEFIQEWFSNDREKARSLTQLVKQRRELAELAENPLLLSLICVLYGRDLQLPKNRVELYERCIRTMLVEWDASRNFRRETKYENLSDYRKVKVLNFFAANMLALGMSAFSWRETEAVLAKYLPGIGLLAEDAHGVLKEVETHNGIITKISATVYSFSHLTLQEFLAASYLVAARKEINALRHVGDPRWIEVFTHIASLLENASDFVCKLLECPYADYFYRLCMASYCISAETGVAPEVRHRVLTELVKELNSHVHTVGRVYVAHGSETRGVLFVEARRSDAMVSDQKWMKEFGRFLSCLNCLVSVVSATVIADIQTLVDSPKLRTMLEWINKAAEMREMHCVFSNALQPGGVVLPLDLTNILNRLARHAAPGFREAWGDEALLGKRARMPVRGNTKQETEFWTATEFPEFWLPSKERYLP